MKTIHEENALSKAEKKNDGKAFIRRMPKKAVVIALAAALVLSGAGVGTWAALSGGRQPSVTASESVRADSEESAVKDDTVYVIADADGSAEKIIVSDWLKNSRKNSSVAEIDGDNSYGIDAAQSYQWNTEGGDISKPEQLPVDVKLTYLLDGKEMSAEEIAGKSGKATIRFDYTNNQKQTVSIDGRDEDIYVPFTVITGAILDDNVFSNIEVSNGKIINDGTRSIVIGFALPGMQESLNLNKDSIEIPDSIEITADVKDFSLTTTLTMVTNDLFNEVSEEADEKKAEKGGSDVSLDRLNAGVHQLVDGSSALYDGTSQLLQKSGVLISGINQLAAGGEKVSGGVDTVRQTLQLLCSRNADLQGGAAKVFDTLLATTRQSVQAAGLNCPELTRDNYEQVLNALSAGLSEESLRSAAEAARPDVTQQVEAAVRQNVAAEVDTHTDEIIGQVTASVEGQVREGVLDSVLGSQNMTREDYEAADEDTKAMIDGAVEQNTAAQMATDDTQAIIQNNVDAAKQQLIEQNMNSDAVRAQINSIVDSKINEALNQKLPQAKDGQKSIQAAIEQLNAYNEFYQGICQYTNGVQALYNGTAELQEGAKELSDGLNRVNDNSGALTDGISRLNSGAMQLSDGMLQFEGSSIEKLASMANGDISGLSVRFQAMKDVSRSYSAQFAGGSEADEGVKFIYRTDSVGGNAD